MKCSVDDCSKAVRGNRRLCGKHASRLARHGDPIAPHVEQRREHGSGSISSDGYLMHTINGKHKRAHIAIAERILGKPLPGRAEVHHADGNKLNNDPSNLVICPDRAYHMLLHQRMDALATCGNVDWRPCAICNRHDDPVNMVRYGRNQPRHKECHSKYNCDNARKLKEQKCLTHSQH